MGGVWCASARPGGIVGIRGGGIAAFTSALHQSECRRADESGVAALLRAHMLGDDTWPPAYARQSGELGAWLADSARLGRWVAIEDDRVIGHVGVNAVEPGPKADAWQAATGAPLDRLAEIGRLVVHPDRRRSGVSDLLTRRCVRGTVSAGLVPVASALCTATASLAMMTSLGWRVIGEVVGRRSGQTILLLVAPAQLTQAALQATHQQATEHARRD